MHILQIHSMIYTDNKDRHMYVQIASRVSQYLMEQSVTSTLYINQVILYLCTLSDVLHSQYASGYVAKVADCELNHKILTHQLLF